MTVLAGPELSAYRSAALGAGQADPMASEITYVTNMVRGRVAACLRNRLGPEETIPEKLMSAACDILAVRIPKRAAGKNPTKSREEAQKDALDLLKDVAACHFAIDDPLEYTQEIIFAPVPTIRAKRQPREFGRAEEEGA